MSSLMARFEEMLTAYYRLRGWDERGLPPATAAEINALVQPLVPWLPSSS